MARWVGPAAGHDRWQGRPLIGSALGAALFLGPVVLSVVAAALTARLLPSPTPGLRLFIWWFVVLTVPLLVLSATQPAAQRLAPLALLLKMTMVFPDRAPRRLAVARKAGNTRDLARRLEQARQQGVDDEPTRAAEQILALSTALSAHDRMTRGHSERVRALVDMLAVELGLSQEDRDRLRWSALLHDIGKMAVHPDILNKPGALDPAEWEIIRRHPLEGARLTAPLSPWLGPWANTIAEHHECFDGTGYPHGLAGDGISFGGRIVAVADAYDVMTAIRSYKRPLGAEVARSELAAGAGTQFDPRVVRAFLALSVGRLRIVEGPLAWLGSLPFTNGLGRLAQLAGTTGHVVAAAALTLAVTTSIGATAATAAGAHQSGVAAAAGGPSVTGDRNGATATSGASSATGTNGRAAGSGSGGGSAGTRSSGAAGTGSRGRAASGSHGAAGGGSTGPPSGGGSGSGSAGSSSNSGSSGTPSSAPASGGSGTTGTTSPSPTSTTTPPTTTTTSTLPTGPPSLFTLVDGGGQTGRPQLGDRIVVTYHLAPSPGAFCAGWSGASDLVDGNVRVNGVKGSGGAGDVITSVTDNIDCPGGFHFGSIDLNQSGKFSNAVTFGGAGPQCVALLTGGCSRIHWDGSHTLTITLGQESSGQPTNKSPDVATYLPDPALGQPGPISSVTEVQF